MNCKVGSGVSLSPRLARNSQGTEVKRGQLPGILACSRPKGQRSRGDKGDFLRLSGECQPARLLCKLWAEPRGQAGREEPCLAWSPQPLFPGAGVVPSLSRRSDPAPNLAPRPTSLATLYTLEGFLSPFHPEPLTPQNHHLLRSRKISIASFFQFHSDFRSVIRRLRERHERESQALSSRGTCTKWRWSKHQGCVGAGPWVTTDVLPCSPLGP